MRYLNLFGFRVEEATTGDELIAAMQVIRPHVVVTEVRLPRGSQVTPRLANEFHVPFIVTSTDGASPVPPEASAMLIKPFPLETMLKEVRRVLTLTEQAAQGVLG